MCKPTTMINLLNNKLIYYLIKDFLIKISTLKDKILSLIKFIN